MSRHSLNRQLAAGIIAQGRYDRIMDIIEHDEASKPCESCQVKTLFSDAITPEYHRQKFCQNNCMEVK